jgi:hypothetical protein
MQEPSQTTEDNNKNIELKTLEKVFIINNIKQVDQTREFVRYEFEGEDFAIQSLYLNVNYANDKTAGQVSPYKIITDIMNKIRLFI